MGYKPATTGEHKGMPAHYHPAKGASRSGASRTGRTVFKYPALKKTTANGK